METILLQVYMFRVNLEYSDFCRQIYPGESDQNYLLQKFDQFRNGSLAASLDQDGRDRYMQAFERFIHRNHS
jgi:hypothetical protein